MIETEERAIDPSHRRSIINFADYLLKRIEQKKTQPDKTRAKTAVRRQQRRRDYYE